MLFYHRCFSDKGDLPEVGRVVADEFDFYVCRDPVDMKDREPGEAAVLLKDSLLHAGVPGENIAVIPDLHDAVASTLSKAEAGDFVVIITGVKAREVWSQLEAYHAQLRASDTGPLHEFPS